MDAKNYLTRFSQPEVDGNGQWHCHGGKNGQKGILLATKASHSEILFVWVIQQFS